MGTATTNATPPPPARAEIRKRQNRDSARRSREKRKSHLRDVAESVEIQSRRVRELDARVAQLEALVHRAVRPRAKRSATRIKSASTPTLSVVTAPTVATSQQPPPSYMQQQQQEQQRRRQQQQQQQEQQEQSTPVSGPAPQLPPTSEPAPAPPPPPVPIDQLVQLANTDTAFALPTTPTTALSFEIDPWTSPIDSLDPISPDPVNAIVNANAIDPYVIGRDV